ncbi:MAG: hypothetical protein JXR10_17150 [Cyclobacteriaceae bacterium]
MRMLFTIWLMCLAQVVFSQRTAPQEEVYLQINGNTLLAGETLYFSAFVTKAEDGKLSSLSKILYVELIGENDQVVFQQKVLLNNGRGNGSFFVPSLVSTGSYQLVAYTRWMKNFENYFQSQIYLINPFEPYEIPKREQETIVRFYPESGSIIPDISNQVVLKITDAYDRPLVRKGKIVDDLGDKVCDVITAQNGLARFELKAQTGRTYQAIFEDNSGNFQFFTLPRSTNSPYLNLNNNTHSYTFKPSFDDTKESQFIITDGYRIVFQSEIIGSQPITVSKKLFKPGAYLAGIIQEGALIVQRPFVHLEDLEQNKISRESYGLRSEVKLPLELPAGSNVSVSVFKPSLQEINFSLSDHALFSGLSAPWSHQWSNHWDSLDMQIMISEWQWPVMQNDEVGILPELRGELISGQLTSNKLPLKNGLVTFSISGEYYQLSSARCDENGLFTIQQPITLGNHIGYLTTSDTSDRVNIDMDNQFLDQYPSFDYAALLLDSMDIQKIIDRSVQVQIENAYFSPSDSTFSFERPAQFGDYKVKYVLDEFNRFPKMYEHFIEFIPEVLARDNRFNKKIKPLIQYALPDKLDPLILLDGVPVADEEILDFSPYKIESIGVINNRIFSGPLIVDGLVSFHSFDKDLQGFKTGRAVEKIDYQGLERPVFFESPNYTNPEEVSSLPDYRQQLYWNPEMTVAEGDSLVFFTGNTTGVFLVKIEGLHEGKPISKEFEIEVK